MHRRTSKSHPYIRAILIAATGGLAIMAAAGAAERAEADSRSAHFQTISAFSDARLVAADGDDEAAFALHDAVIDVETGRVQYFAIRGEDGLHAVEPRRIGHDGDDLELRIATSGLKNYRPLAAEGTWPQIDVDDDGRTTATSRVRRASSLLGATVHDCFGRELGRVEDVLIDHDGGHHAHVVLSWLHDDDLATLPREEEMDAEAVPEYYAIPLADLRMHATDGSILILRRPLTTLPDWTPRPWPDYFRSPASQYVSDSYQDESRGTDDDRDDDVERRNAPAREDRRR